MIRSTIRQMIAPVLAPEEYVASLFSNLGPELDEFERNELSGIFKYFNVPWVLNQKNTKYPIFFSFYLVL